MKLRLADQVRAALSKRPRTTLELYRCTVNRGEVSVTRALMYLQGRREVRRDRTGHWHLVAKPGSKRLARGSRKLATEVRRAVREERRLLGR